MKDTTNIIDQEKLDNESISNNEEILPLKKFSIQVGSLDEEFFTTEKPNLTYDELIIKNYFIKGVVSKEVRGKIIEEFYPVIGELSEKHFSLKDGILIKEIFSNDLTWFDNSQFSAEERVKDLVIAEYERAIPALEYQMTRIEEQLRSQQLNNKGYRSPLEEL